jgi:hypothetical protein
MVGFNGHAQILEEDPLELLDKISPSRNDSLEKR